jgi:hypothetical protein
MKQHIKSKSTKKFLWVLMVQYIAYWVQFWFFWMIISVNCSGCWWYSKWFSNLLGSILMFDDNIR